MRSVRIDSLKTLGALTIALHHIVSYFPGAALLPAALDAGALAVLGWFADDARFMVQFFLVMGGYLTCQSLVRSSIGDAPGAGFLGRIGRALGDRYIRLAPELWLAVLMVVAIKLALQTLHSPALDLAWVSDFPSASVLLAHATLLQDILAIPAVSAGIWYVAIDLQLFAVLCCISLLGTSSPMRLPLAITALAAISLVWGQDIPGGDVAAPYFFFAYGAGALASMAQQRHRWALGGLAVLSALVIHQAVVDPQVRPFWALGCALLLSLPRGPALSEGLRTLVARASDRSYAFFLGHYAVILLVSALWLHPSVQGLMGHALHRPENSVGWVFCFIMLVLVGSAMLAVPHHWGSQKVRHALRSLAALHPLATFSHRSPRLP